MRDDLKNELKSKNPYSSKNKKQKSGSTNGINFYLDLTLKIFSLLFTLFLTVGGSIIWTYLNNVGLHKEFINVIGSPQISFLACSYSILIAFGFFYISMAFPTLFIGLIHALNTHFKKDNISKTTATSLICIPITIYMSGAYLNITGVGFVAPYLLSGLLMALIYINKTYQAEKFTDWLGLLAASAAFITIYLPLAFSLLLFIKCITYLQLEEYQEWLAMFLISVLYSLFVSMVRKPTEYISYLPIIGFSIALCVLLFQSVGLEKVITKIGFGGYYASYTLDEKHLQAIIGNSKYQISETQEKNIKILHHVWVVAAPPNKIIFSDKKGEPNTFSFPSIAILNDINEN